MFELVRELRVPLRLQRVDEPTPVAVLRGDLLVQGGALLSTVPAPIRRHLVRRYERMPSGQTQPQVEVDAVALLLVEAADAQERLTMDDRADGGVQPVPECLTHDRAGDAGRDPAPDQCVVETEPLDRTESPCGVRVPLQQPGHHGDVLGPPSVVRVQPSDRVPRSGPDASIARGSVSAVRLSDDPRTERLRDGRGGVRRSVIDHDELVHRPRLRSDRIECLREITLAVVARHDRGYAQHQARVRGGAARHLDEERSIGTVAGCRR